MPDRYLSETDGGPFVTHINVALFKEHWQKSIGDSRMVTESRDQGVNYKHKEELRRRLMNYAVAHKIVE